MSMKHLAGKWAGIKKEKEMQALQTLSQREFEMMQCFWEADEPLKMKELQTRWAHGETPQSDPRH